LDEKDQLVAFAIVMPLYSEALKKANGKLFPFGIFHLNKTRKTSKDVLFYLIGIHPEYQNKGVTAMIIHEYHQTFKQKGVVNCYRSPELEDNLAIQQMWKHFNPSVYKRRCTYKLELNSSSVGELQQE
jgi:GNAT superfamily N-acetyltransferase